VHPATRIGNLLAQHLAFVPKEFVRWIMVHGCPYVASIPQLFHHPCNTTASLNAQELQVNFIMMKYSSQKD
jgi:hypothetical protein